MSNIDDALKREVERAVKLTATIEALGLARDADAFLKNVRDAVLETLDKTIQLAPEAIEVIVKGVAQGLISSAIERYAEGKN